MKKILIALFMLALSMPVFSQTIQEDDRGYIVKIGQKAPDFTIKYLDGKTTRLSKLKDKVVMLQFTASWCGVCRKEMPHIESDIWQKYKNNPAFALIGIDYKEDAEKIKSFIDKTGVSYPVVLDEDGKIFHLYAGEKAGVTRNIIIDRKGNIIFMTRLFDANEFEQMKQVIEKELKKK